MTQNAPDTRGDPFIVRLYYRNPGSPALLDIDYFSLIGALVAVGHRKKYRAKIYKRITVFGPGGNILEDWHAPEGNDRR